MSPKQTGLLISLCYMGLLLFLTIAPATGTTMGDAISLIHPDMADLLHIPAYGLLAWLLLLSIRRYEPARIQVVLVVMLAAVGFGAVMELCQTIVPGRTPSFTDCVLNAVGIFVVGGWYLAQGSRRHQRTVSQPDPTVFTEPQ